MTRVAFLLTRNLYDWLGGLNYLSTLIEAVRAHEPGLEPVLFTGEDAPPDALRRFDGLERHVTAQLDAPRGRALAHAASVQATGRNAQLTRLLREHRIDVLSHASPTASLPVLSWIPDFQHRHLPHLFSRRERLLRELEIRRIGRRATRVIVSSEAALEDLVAGAPELRSRARVLHFVPAPPPAPDACTLAETLERHDLTRYVHLPNQLWVHKNHEVVVEALGLLRNGGRQDVVVVATGDVLDYRNAGVHERLQRRIAELGVADSMRLLGRLPYTEVTGLMHASVAVLNPSLFEGWSTSVEEAKSVGKRAVLSDIPVHREQAPPGGHYFDPHDPESLATALLEVWDGTDEAEERRMAEASREALPARQRAFAATYAAVVRELLPC